MIRSCAGAALLVIAAVSPARGAENAPLPIAAITDLATISAYGPVATVSPDGSLAAFTVMNRQARQVRVVSLKDFTSRSLSAKEDDAFGPAWSPDGRSLAFIRGRAGRYGLWLWNAQTAQLTQVSEAVLAGNPPWLRPIWISQGQSIVVVLGSQPPPLPPANKQAAPPQTDVRVFRANRPGGATRLPSERPAMSGGIGIVDVRTGEVRRIFSGFAMGLHLNPAGTQLAVLERLPRVNPNTFELFNRLQVVDLASGEAKVLTDKVTAVYDRISWSADGRYLGWVQDYVPEIGPAFLVSVADGVVRKVRAEPEVRFAAKSYGGRPPLWGSDSRNFFLIAEGQLWIGNPLDASARSLTALTDWKIVDLVPGLAAGTAVSTDGYKSVVAVVANKETLQEGFARIDLRSGALSLLRAQSARGVDSYNKAVVLPGGKTLLYVSETAAQPIALWMGGLDLRNTRRILPLNPVLEGRKYGNSRLLQWKNSRGETLQGALLLPADYKPGHQYPLIVDIYAEEGVVKSLNSFGMDPEGSGQLFATRGYAILKPDTRLRVGTPVADLVGDVIPALDAAAQTGSIDGSRIAVMGHSYGGYNTLALASHSDRFRAAVSSAGFADLISGVYGNEGKGTMSPGWAEGGQQGRMGGSPWEVAQQYLDNSPLWQMDKLHAPLLLVHGLDDDTVPPFASTMVFNALQRLGRQVEYVQYPGEGHAILQRDHRIDYFTRVLAWFDEHLDLSRDGAGTLLFDGANPRSRNGAPPLQPADFLD